MRLGKERPLDKEKVMMLVNDYLRGWWMYAHHKSVIRTDLSKGIFVFWLYSWLIMLIYTVCLKLGLHDRMGRLHARVCDGRAK